MCVAICYFTYSNANTSQLYQVPNWLLLWPHISGISEECFEEKIVIEFYIDFLIIKNGYGTYNQCKWYV